MIQGDEFEEFMRRSHSTGLIQVPPEISYLETTSISISRSSGHLSDVNHQDVSISRRHGHLQRGSHPTFHIGNNTSGIIPDPLLLSPEYKPQMSPLVGDFQPSSSSKMTRKRPSSLKVCDY